LRLLLSIILYSVDGLFFFLRLFFLSANENRTPDGMMARAVPPSSGDSHSSNPRQDNEQTPVMRDDDDCFILVGDRPGTCAFWNRILDSTQLYVMFGL
jgi:hypothetical protein